MPQSKLCSKIITIRIVKSIMWLQLILDKRRDPPVNAAEVASQPRPCWVAYVADARVTSLPDRTSWQPRYKAGADGTESHDSRESALSAGAGTVQVPS